MIGHSLWLALCLSFGCLLPFGFAQQVIQVDDFGDESLGSNTQGLGLAGGWRTQKSGSAVGLEKGGMYEVSVASEHASHALIAHRETATFPFWNDDGVRITWVIDSINVVTPHQFKKPFAFHWDLGVISADYKDSRWPYRASGSKEGAFFVFIGKQDAGPACRIRVEVYNKDVQASEAHPGDQGMAQPINYVEDLVFPVKVIATLNRKEWTVQIADKINRGNWTTDLSNGKDRNAVIDSEFANGAYLFLHGRNSGISGKKEPYEANSGKLQSVQVELLK
jgi:hypothetical protein